MMKQDLILAGIPEEIIYLDFAGFRTLDSIVRCNKIVEYIELKGLLPMLLSTFFPSMFKNQSEKWMKQFKLFAESK